MEEEEEVEVEVEEETIVIIGLIGQENCGKTCFVNKLVNNDFKKKKKKLGG